MKFNETDRTALENEIMVLLREYDYTPTSKGVDAIIDEWLKNKGWIVDLMKKHPNYNGKYQIVFDQSYSRSINTSCINDFGEYLGVLTSDLLIRDTSVDFDKILEDKDKYDRLFEAVAFLEENDVSRNEILIDKKGIEFYEEERKIVNEKYHEYISSERVLNDIAYTEESINAFKKAKGLISIIKETSYQIVDDCFVESVNEFFPEAKVRVGQKVSRVVNKLCKIIGFDKDSNYNREYAVYSDAINPLLIVRHTILSVHPIDYLTMSFGNSWASCHTIDKKNKRGMPNNYEGCYSSGTLSYMLDPSSLVFYTVDKGYSGDKLELQAKINRNMFHLGEDGLLVQGRVYPQDNDYEGNMYREIRNVVQKVISDCMGVPNLWVNKKGTSECERVIYSYGTHYEDYSNFDNCNVSFLKDKDGNINTNTSIKVGHDPICPVCGEEHDIHNNIECEDCQQGVSYCAQCGEQISVGSSHVHCIDGDYYCEDCCFYCTHHERWEVGDPYCEEDGLSLCQEAYNHYYVYCRNCDNLIYKYDAILTEDGYYFCCESCANDNGYIENENGKWILKTEDKEGIEYEEKAS